MTSRIMTPAEVDNVLVNAMTKVAQSTATIEVHTEGLANYKMSIDNYVEMLAYPTISDSDEKRINERIAMYRTKIQTSEEIVKTNAATLEEFSAIETACNKEFARRGGWTRFWIVINSNGHIHSSTSCTTCFPTTQYGWLPNLSGSTDAEVVELAGMSACTICFPDAPVEFRNRPSQIEDPAKKAAREAREAAKAEKDAKKAAKAIANPDGSIIKLSGTFGSKIVTEAEAQRVFVSNLISLLLDAEDERYAIPNRAYVKEMAVDNAVLLTALANKRGTSEEAELASLTKKARTNIKRDWK